MTDEKSAKLRLKVIIGLYRTYAVIDAVAEDDQARAREKVPTFWQQYNSSQFDRIIRSSSAPTKPGTYLWEGYYYFGSQKAEGGWFALPLPQHRNSALNLIYDWREDTET